MEKILETFRTDLQTREGRGGGLTYEPSVQGLAMGASPDRKGVVWKPVGPTSIDPAVLFLDRCLQLLKPGGRLLIILPDGVLCNSGDKYVARNTSWAKRMRRPATSMAARRSSKRSSACRPTLSSCLAPGRRPVFSICKSCHARKDDPTHFQDEPQTDVFMAVAETLGYEVKNNTEVYRSGTFQNDLAVIEGAYRRGE